MNLFETNIPDAKLHQYFKILKNESNLSNVREVLQSWGEGLLQRKGEGKKFLNEFQTTFNSSFWELYLNKVFSEMGLIIDYSKNSPDFCLTTANGYRFNVEAVISDRNKDDPPISNESHFKEISTLRLSGKIKDKRDLYIGSNNKKTPYSSLEHVANKPFVIAITPFDSDKSLMQNNEMINRVLFGIDTPNKDSLAHGRQKTISSITKKSGADVKLGIFTDDSHKEISAVIFSTTGTFGKALIESGSARIIRSNRYRTGNGHRHGDKPPLNQTSIKAYGNGNLNYLAEMRTNSSGQLWGSDISVCHSKHHKENIFDGIHVYYNPYATHPLDTNIFYPKEITHNFYNTEDNIPIQNHPDGALVSRQVYELSQKVYDYLISVNSPEMLHRSYKSFFDKN